MNQDQFNKMWDKIEDDLGMNNADMRRDRPYDGQPHTSTGVRGSTEIRGITFRDLRDCFIRAFIKSHSAYSRSLEVIEPNMTLCREADKGEHAFISENDVYRLVGDIDPIAVAQNLACEVEKMMGIFPNVDQLTIKE